MSEVTIYDVYGKSYSAVLDGGVPVVRKMLKTPNDILRLFASLTCTDVSLATEIRFSKTSRSEKRFLLEMLEYAKKAFQQKWVNGDLDEKLNNIELTEAEIGLYERQMTLINK